MDILVVLETNNGALHRMSKEAIVAAQSISKDHGKDVAVLALGENADVISNEVAQYELNDILIANHDLITSYNSDGYAECVKQVIEMENPSFVFVGHTYQTRDYFPKVSARLDAPFIPDVVSLDWNGGNPTFSKTVYNGKLVSNVVTAGEGTTLISFQASAFSEDNIVSGSASARTVDVQLDLSQIRTSSEAPFQEESGGIDLSSADLIVSVGRGIEKEDNIQMAKDLANALNGELASSRPVVDAGWLSPSHQVGSSGQSVSPNLYIALGISGAIQHVVGIKGSKNIIAINKDADAPIFEIADYGVVGNVLEIVPKLKEALTE